MRNFITNTALCEESFSLKTLVHVSERIEKYFFIGVYFVKNVPINQQKVLEIFLQSSFLSFPKRIFLINIFCFLFSVKVCPGVLQLKPLGDIFLF